MKVVTAIVLMGVLAGCASSSGRQQDLSVWQGLPVEALDTHSLWTTIPMNQVIKKNHTEIRNYTQSKPFTHCTAGGSGGAGGRIMANNALQTCTTETFVCEYTFYINHGTIERFESKGDCFTDESLQPEPKYRKLKVTPAT